MDISTLSFEDTHLALPLCSQCIVEHMDWWLNDFRIPWYMCMMYRDDRLQDIPEDVMRFANVHRNWLFAFAGDALPTWDVDLDGVTWV